MSESTGAEQKTSVTDFENQAAGKSAGLPGEFFGFLMHNKKWWMTPIILVLLLLGGLVLLSGTAVAPFIYTLF